MVENDVVGESAQPGWYPGPDGNLHYWDGTTWLNIAPPADESQTPKRPKRLGRVIGIIVAVSLVLAGGAGAYVWKSTQDRQAAEVAAQEAEEKKEAARKAEEQRQAAEESRLAAQEEVERTRRASVVKEIEEAIKVNAEENVAEGYLVGPIIDVSCTPLGGGSTDDIQGQTTVFECFVANEDRGDGSYAGYFYEATMNWDIGSYTFGLQW